MELQLSRGEHSLLVSGRTLNSISGLSLFITGLGLHLSQGPWYQLQNCLEAAGSWQMFARWHR